MAARTTYKTLFNFALANSPWDVASAVLGTVGIAFVLAKPVFYNLRHKKVEDQYLADPAHAYLAERYPSLSSAVGKL